VALAAWQSSKEVNSFSSRRDVAIRKGQHFPLADFTPEENLGHDLFYGKARCAGCHNGVPAGDDPDPLKGEALRELYTDSAFHNIGVPFNREIPSLKKGEKVGLSSHVTVQQFPQADISGFFKTPTLRNVAKGLDGGFVKGYAHNGWFKSLKSIVHFYNTRDSLRDTRKCEAPPINIKDATEAEARANNCWPPSEFGNQAGFVIGRLGLTEAEEDAIVAYMATLTDNSTPTPP
jgi:cytochrome c peroxidase